jgi:hypothetical protein
MRPPVALFQALALALLTLVPRGSVAADVVELESGERVEGLIRQADPVAVIVEVGGQVIAFERERVRAIYFETPPWAARRPMPGEALQAVKALWSGVTGTGSRLENGARLRELRSTLDRYLAGAAGASPGASDPVGDAIRYYVLAESAWGNLSPSTRTVWLKRDALLDRCRAYRDFAQAMRAKGEAYYAERTRGYVNISDAVIPVLWTCASEKIAEAEKLLALPAR